MEILLPAMGPLGTKRANSRITVQALLSLASDKTSLTISPSHPPVLSRSDGQKNDKNFPTTNTDQFVVEETTVLFPF